MVKLLVLLVTATCLGLAVASIEDSGLDFLKRLLKAGLSNKRNYYHGGYGGDTGDHYGGDTGDHYGGDTGGNYGGDYGSNHGNDYGSNHGNDYGSNHGNDYGSNHGNDYGSNHGNDYGSNHGNDYGSNHGNDYGSNHGNDYGSNHGNDYGSNHGNDYGSNHGNDYGSNHGNDYGSNHGNDYGSNHGNDYGSNHGNDYGSNHGNDHGSNHGGDYGGDQASGNYAYYDEDYSDEYNYWMGDESGGDTDDGDYNYDNPDGDQQDNEIDNGGTGMPVTGAADLDGGKTPTGKCGLQDPTKASTRSLSKISLRSKILNMLTRIVGGMVAKPGDYPWQVAVGSPEESRPRHIDQMCGASLITNEWILTAAHCFYGENGEFTGKPQDWRIRIGDHNISYGEQNKAELQVTPSKIIVHPKYNPHGYNNDIALMKLSKPLKSAKFNSFINTVCLRASNPNNLKPKAGTRCIVSGWGALGENKDGSQVLRAVEVDILEDSKCGGIESDEICAGVLQGGKDSCQGDSGGPLVCPQINSKGQKRYFQVGVVSHGEGCAQPGKPGVYASVAHKMDWIKQTIRNN